MKNKLFTAVCLGLAILACNKEKNVISPAVKSGSVATHAVAKFTDTADRENSQYISVEVANEMISSYLYSINSSGNDSDVRSFTVNADSLRAYLSNTSVKSVKLMFAHTMGYINAGNSGVYAGYQSGALTIVVAGVDSAGNYVYHGGNVLDHLAPCPYTCPVGGTAANYTLQ